jgi:drug/metabolite transporter (DMT)-like permease
MGMPRSGASSAASSSDRGVARREAGRGRWMVVGAAVLWGGSATLARFLFRDRHVPALTVVELRLATAVVLLGPWLAWRHPAALRLRRRDIPYFLVLGTVGVAAIQGSYYYSVSVLGVGLAILLQYLAPSLVVLWHVVRGGRIAAGTIVAIVAAVAGTALLVGGVDVHAVHARPWQWAIGFGTAFVFAFYILYSKYALGRYRPETVLFYSFSIAAVFWAIVTPPARILAAHYDAGTWILLGAIGITSVLVPFALFYAGLRRLTSAQAGIVATLEPVVAIVTSAIALGEGLHLFQWLGALLVLGAAVVESMGGRLEETHA